MGFVFELLCVLGGHDGESTDLTLAQAQAGIAALYGEADSQLRWTPEQIKLAFDEFGTRRRAQGGSAQPLPFEAFAAACSEKLGASV